MTTTYIKSSFLQKQEREVTLLPTIYSVLSVDSERAVSAQKIGDEIGVTENVMQAFAATLEKSGILNRRLEFGARVNGSYRSGRTVWWRLKVPLNEAVTLLNSYHDAERRRVDHPPAPRPNTLKTRIMEVLRESNSFASVRDLAKAISRNGDKLDLHSVTHVLYSLKRENKIDFDTSTNKDKIPYNIRLAKSMKIREARMEELMPTEPETNGKVPEWVAVTPEPEPVEIVSMLTPERFPMIEAMIIRHTRLEQAARLVEDETDLALALLERAQPTEYDAEVTRLYEAYQTCLGKV